MKNIYFPNKASVKLLISTLQGGLVNMGLVVAKFFESPGDMIRFQEFGCLM